MLPKRKLALGMSLPFNHEEVALWPEHGCPSGQRRVRGANFRESRRGVASRCDSTGAPACPPAALLTPVQLHSGT